jgi:VCBS repeat-containing protein
MGAILVPAVVAWSAAGDAELASNARQQPIVLEPGASAQVTIANEGGRSTGALVTTLSQSPGTAGFSIWSDGCTGPALAPGKTCGVTVGYGSTPSVVKETATLTVMSRKPSGPSVTIRFRTPNHAPSAADDHLSVDEDVATTIPASLLLSNDSDPDDDPLSVIGVGQPSHGALVPDGDGTFVYLPDADHHGDDAFTYTIADPSGARASALVHVDVNPLNDPPVASDDTVAGVEDTALDVPIQDLLANDTDVDGDPLSLLVDSGPSHGTLSLQGDGSYRYDPDADHHGADSFTYVANDGAADSNVATVTIELDPVNDPPFAQDDGASTDEDTALTVAATAGVLANDADVDGDALIVTEVDGSAADVGQPIALGSGAWLTLNGDGSYLYDPGGAFQALGAEDGASDTIVYRVSDGAGATDDATLTVSVAGVNDPPVAADDEASVDQDTPGNVIDVLGNDADPDAGDVPSVTGVGAASHGTATVQAGAVTYTPEAGYVGADAFTYTIADGSGATSTATVTMTVTEVDEGPTAEPDCIAYGGTYDGTDVPFGELTIDWTCEGQTAQIPASNADAGIAFLQSLFDPFCPDGAAIMWAPPTYRYVCFKI